LGKRRGIAAVKHSENWIQNIVNIGYRWLGERHSAASGRFFASAGFSTVDSLQVTGGARRGGYGEERLRKVCWDADWLRGEGFRLTRVAGGAFPHVRSAVAHSAAAFVLAYEAAASESVLFDRAVLRRVFPARTWGHGKGKFRSIGLRYT
jgi:hypothetical protein